MGLNYEANQVELSFLEDDVFEAGRQKQRVQMSWKCCLVACVNILGRMLQPDYHGSKGMLKKNSLLHG